jgi:diguanylate cyclase (GGDEF)-like protein
MSGCDIGLELLMLMEAVILRRAAPGSYDLEGLVPGFYTRLFPREADGSGCRAPWNHSSMLEFFLGEAEEFFESGPKPGASLSSGLWVENLDSGKELPLTATAWVLKNGQIILVQAVREEYAQRARITRRSRSDARSRSDLLMEKRKITQLLQKYTTKKNNLFDPVTKLYNREVLMDLVQAQIASLSTSAPNLALIMMSLDHQPEEGSEEQPVASNDDLLGQLGQVLRRSLRKSDAAVHYGEGVVFIVAPATNMPQSLLAAERLIALFKNHDFGLGRPLSLYLGCTVYQPGEEAQVFIDRTRQAHLDAVKAGPNKIGQRPPLGKATGFAADPAPLEDRRPSSSRLP